MTRDVHRTGNGHDGEAAIYSALWAATQNFPQLPVDSPSEVKKASVDVEDPRRVYTIYRASRRHRFQILVERYIIQLRYGCQSNSCTTPTCFTCRKRVAGGAPLRRYTATSARTLACHLASQDDPERGLCPYIGGQFHKSHMSSKIVLRAGQPHTEDGCRGGTLKGTIQSNGDVSGDDQPKLASERRSSLGQVRADSSDEAKRQQEEGLRSFPVQSTITFGQPVAKIDHKSFVQNLFNTEAVKLLEWLAPNNLDALTSPYSEIRKFFSGSSKSRGSESTFEDASASASVDSVSSSSTGFTDSNSRSISSYQDTASSLEVLSDKETAMNKGGSNAGSIVGIQSSSEAIISSVHDATAQPKSRRSSASHNLTRGTGGDGAGSEDFSRCQNGLTHGPIISSNEEKFTSRCASNETNVKAQGKKKQYIPTPVSRIPMAPDRIMNEKSNSRRSNNHAASFENATLSHFPTTPTHLQEEKGDRESPNQSLDQTYEHTSEDSHVQRQTQPGPRPQSLCILSIELIELLSNVLESIHTDSFEDLTLHETPTARSSSWTRQILGDIVIPSSIALKRLTNTDSQWKGFIEQSLFYVLSNPRLLLQSFIDHNQKLLDTQTLWYCLMRLTDVAAPLVFDSLWMTANDLYLPPRELLGLYEWGPKPEVAFTSSEVAQLTSICLHALVAAVPELMDNSTSLVRSIGRTFLHRREAAFAVVDLSLRQDDIFSDELALRLARRTFSAIPVWRQYQSLIRFTSNSQVSPEVDILDAVLSPLNFLDIETPSAIDFSAKDRRLHEKRVPNLLIEWARTILLQDWDGKPEVPADGPFGGALAMMAALYTRRKSLLLGDGLFKTDYFADRLDSTEMPVEWLSFDSKNKTVHLLDYPYLFSPSVLVTYFRAINFSRMSRAFEAAGSMMGRVQAFMSPGTLITDPGRRDDLHEKLRIATSKFMVLQIRRTNVLQDAFNQLWRREERELYRPLKIRLGEENGEEGSDSGGVQQEFFRLAIAEALNPDYGAFTVDERTKMIWFQPGSPQPLWKFELIGLIFSLAIYNGLTLPVTFPKALYRKLLKVPASELHHIEDGWPDLASGLTSLLEWDEKDGLVSDVFARTYEFSISFFGQEISQDMSDPKSAVWPQFRDAKRPNPSDARVVDATNRNEYVSDYIKWLTDVSIRPQFEAFQRGFLTCLERRSLSLFEPDLLQSVMEGIQDIDIAELKRYARYVGWESNHRSIKDFWSVVKRYGSDEKKKLLEFVTASDRVPVGGMQNLQFVIQRNGVGDIDGRLPTSYTCYGTLLLPEYSNKEILREKLGMALENAKGFGFA